MENDVEKLQQEVQKLQNEMQALKTDVEEIKEALAENKGKKKKEKKASVDAFISNLDESLFEQYTKGKMTYTEYENKAREDLENKKGDLSWWDCAKCLENETKKSEFRNSFVSAVIVVTLLGFAINWMPEVITVGWMLAVLYILYFLTIIVGVCIHKKFSPWFKYGVKMLIVAALVTLLMVCLYVAMGGTTKPNQISQSKEEIVQEADSQKADPQEADPQKAIEQEAAKYGNTFLIIVLAFVAFMFPTYQYMKAANQNKEYFASLTQIAESQAQAQPACPQTFAVQAAEQDKTHAMKVTISPVKSKE